MPYVGAALNEPVHLFDILKAGIKQQSSSPALLSMDKQWTWEELDRATSTLAAHYLASGLKPGDRVASLMPNRVELLAHYLACFKAERRRRSRISRR
jgi:acyl-CoA synthetase (AMP-forming)/AMP-acid ligase II